MSVMIRHSRNSQQRNAAVITCSETATSHLAIEPTDGAAAKQQQPMSHSTFIPLTHSHTVAESHCHTVAYTMSTCGTQSKSEHETPTSRHLIVRSLSVAHGRHTHRASTQSIPHTHSHAQSHSRTHAHTVTHSHTQSHTHTHHSSTIRIPHAEVVLRTLITPLRLLVLFSR